MRSFSSDRPTTRPSASSITKAGWVSWSLPPNDPTFPTKMPLTPLLPSSDAHQFTYLGMPKKVTLRYPVPSVRAPPGAAADASGARTGCP